MFCNLGGICLFVGSAVGNTDLEMAATRFSTVVTRPRLSFFTHTSNPLLKNAYSDGPNSRSALLMLINHPSCAVQFSTNEGWARAKLSETKPFSSRVKKNGISDNFMFSSETPKNTFNIFKNFFFKKPPVIKLVNQKPNALKKVLDKTGELYVKYTPVPVQKKVTELNKGVNQEFLNVKTVWNLNKHKKDGTLSQHATYEQMMSFNDLKRDKLKTTGVMICSVIPGGFFILSIPVLLLPRHCMPPSFWSPEQKKPFHKQNHAARLPYIKAISEHVQNADVGDKNKKIIQKISAALSGKQRLNNNDLLAFKDLCYDHPFDLTFTNTELQKAFCHVFEVSAFGNTTSHLIQQAGMIRNLDSKILEMGVDKLTEDQVLVACHMRGLDAGSFSHEANLFWLKNWLQLSKQCQKNDTWFILHAMVIQSVTFGES